MSSKFEPVFFIDQKVVLGVEKERAVYTKVKLPCTRHKNKWVFTPRAYEIIKQLKATYDSKTRNSTNS